MVADVDKSEASASSATGGQTRGYKPVGALLSGIRIMRYLANAKTPLPLTVITKDLGLNPSTCLSLLRTLVKEGYVVLEQSTKLYSMGLGVFELCAGAIEQGADIRALRSRLGDVCEAFNVSITLWRKMSENRKVLSMEVLPPGGMRIKMEVGQRLPLLVGASGRLMAAFSGQSKAQLKKAFAEVRADHPKTFQSFWEDVREAKKRGWAIDDQNYVSGVCSVSVPVLAPGGALEYAITATMFSTRFTSETAEALVPELIKSAELLTATLRFNELAT